MITSERILFLLKTRGPQTAQELAQLLEMTSMGTRKHLESWQEKGLVEFEDHAEKLGRPQRRWFLSAAGHERFPDRHSELTLQLIEQVQSVFGASAMQQLIDAREQQTYSTYKKRIPETLNLLDKLQALCDIRNHEGYMAELSSAEDGEGNQCFIMIENHCPICAAAHACQNFCRSELQLFQQVIGDRMKIERIEHILQGARRCAYRITPIQVK
jgi:predicted ArsR family transcriptional regulator